MFVFDVRDWLTMHRGCAGYGDGDGICMAGRTQVLFQVMFGRLYEVRWELRLERWLSVHIIIMAMHNGCGGDNASS